MTADEILSRATDRLAEQLDYANTLVEDDRNTHALIAMSRAIVGAGTAMIKAREAMEMEARE